jgi:hypothetical protein
VGSSASATAHRLDAKPVLAGETSRIAHSDVDPERLLEWIGSGRSRPVLDVIAHHRIDGDGLRGRAELEKKVGLGRLLSAGRRDERRAHEQHCDIRDRAGCVHVTTLPDVESTLVDPRRHPMTSRGHCAQHEPRHEPSEPKRRYDARPRPAPATLVRAVSKEEGMVARIPAAPHWLRPRTRQRKIVCGMPITYVRPRLARMRHPARFAPTPGQAQAISSQVQHPRQRRQITRFSRNALTSSALKPARLLNTVSVCSPMSGARVGENGESDRRTGQPITENRPRAGWSMS